MGHFQWYIDAIEDGLEQRQHRYEYIDGLCCRQDIPLVTVGGHPIGTK